MIYTRMSAAPPFSPTVVGKRQMFPRPTAEPAVANIMPVFEPKFAIFNYFGDKNNKISIKH